MEIMPIECAECHRVDIMYMIPKEDVVICLCWDCRTDYINAFLDNLNSIKLIPQDE